MNLRDLKSLNSTISEVAKPETQDKSRMIQEGFGNSLSAKARQVVAEQVEGSRGPNPKVPVKKVKDATGSVGIEAERIKRDGQAEMKKMMAKALNRAKKKARLVKEEEEIELAEVAAPGYEDWASNPKVKARFKERYGKRWKQVMYGHSWNMKEAADAEAELDLAEGVSAKRMRIIRKHNVSGKPIKGEVADFMQRSFKKKFYKDKEKFGGATSAVLGRARLKHSAMKAKGLAEAEQLDEAGYKRLMRIKKAAYKADLASRNINPKTPKQDIELNRLVNRHGKLGRAAAEGEAKVAAGMARRGGASPDAIRGGGSRIGKSGKYTQKAGALANQRDKALAKFRGKAASSLFVAPNYSSADKRASQQRYAKFDDQSRSGDFGQDNQAAMRTTYNYLKRTGKLKTK